MRSSSRLTLGSLLVALACTSSERAAEVPPESAHLEDPVFVEPPPKPEGPERDLGPLLGGVVVERTPAPGRWASHVEFDQHRFVTMEHTIANGMSGTAVLHLGDNGVARACFSTDESSRSDISHYQAHDGQDHHYENDHAIVVGMSGTWKLDGKGPEILVIFDRMNWQACEVDPTREPFAQPPLRCFGFSATAKIPSDALLCSVPKELNSIADLSLLIGDSPRAGSWAHRFDPSGHGTMPPENAVPWLLLGKDPGLELQASDTDRDAKPLTIQVAQIADPVALPEEQP